LRLQRREVGLRLTGARLSRSLQRLCLRLQRLRLRLRRRRRSLSRLQLTREVVRELLTLGLDAFELLGLRREGSLERRDPHLEFTAGGRSLRLGRVSLGHRGGHLGGGGGDLPVRGR